MTRNELCNATLRIIEDEDTTRPEKLQAAWAWIEGYTIGQAAQFLSDMLGEARMYSGSSSDEDKTIKMQAAYLRHLNRAVSPNGERRLLSVVSHMLPESLKNSLSDLYVQSHDVA
jgi:hypothetical protein